MTLSMIHGIKEKANTMGVPYQALIKMKLAELLDENPKPKVAKL